MNIGKVGFHQQPVIEKNVFCPYCKSEDALLISEITSQKAALQIPDYGKKYWLCVIFTFGLYMLVHGFPMIETKRTYEYMTYGFCAHCGKSYNASIPVSLSRAEHRKSKVYLSWNQKLIMGVCGGIAEYTGLSVKLVRLSMVLYGITIIPVILYFVCGLLMEQNPES